MPFLKYKRRLRGGHSRQLNKFSTILGCRWANFGRDMNVGCLSYR